MSNVYVVQGTTGEYDDYMEWIVAAFTSKQRADTYARRANAWLERNGLTAVPTGTRTERKLICAQNPYDRDCRCDYNGTRYFVETITRVNPPLPLKRQEEVR